jgi:monofunctional glycosyltransferase
MTRLRLTVRALVRALVLALIGLLVLPLPVMLGLRFINPPTSAFMLASRYQAYVRGDTHYRVDYRFTPYREISPYLKVAVIASEDQHFGQHAGFDFEQIDQAWQAHAKGQRLRGASTLSQQLVKNLFLWGGPHFVRKGIEAYLTVWLELTVPKARILELYLNIAEFGPGIYGVGAAAPRLFHTTPQTLSLAQAALLSVCLPAPKRLAADRPSAYMLARQDWVIDQMSKIGGLSVLEQFKDGSGQTLKPRR